MSKRKIKFILNTYLFVGMVFITVSIVLVLLPVLPHVIYRIYPEAIQNEKASLTQSLEFDVKKYESTVPEPPKETQLPDYDPSLPKENMIIIPRIGVKAVIQEGNNAENALEKGPWRVNNFGNPEDSELPIIIASHRWGVVGWSSSDRRERSFVKLPETKEGEVIEIIWKQRKYVYKIYSAENNTEINDYDADLILYTCQFYWPNPERIFRYASRIEE